MTPIYDYDCECGAALLDHSIPLVKIDSRNNVKCIKCGKKMKKRQPNPHARYRGEGFNTPNVSGRMD